MYQLITLKERETFRKQLRYKQQVSLKFKIMKKLIFVLLALMVITGYANTDSNYDLSGISKLDTKWYNQAVHESNLTSKKNNNRNLEVIQIIKEENQFFLVYSTGVKNKSFLLTKCVARPINNNVEQILDLELTHPVTKKTHQVVVKYSINQTMWKGLTSPESTHLFTSR